MASEKRAERMRQRWADPEQREKMLRGAAKGHARIAEKLTAGHNEPAPAAEPSAPPAPLPPAAAAAPGSSGRAPRSAGGILRSLFTSSPRDLVERRKGPTS